MILLPNPFKMVKNSTFSFSFSYFLKLQFKVTLSLIGEIIISSMYTYRPYS